jgi:hypothetical protein
MKDWRQMWELLGARKDFRGDWVGDPTLNRLGLHPARIALADLCLALRRRQLRPPRDAAGDLARDGVVVIPDFLPPAQFHRVRAEVTAVLARLEQSQPPRSRGERGFGDRHPFAGGFDRYDGGTLNRFVDIDSDSLPATAEAIRSRELAELCAYAAGFRHRPDRFWLYQTVHGDEGANPDIQKVLHKDTFHSAIKLWLYLDDVAFDDGPFVYVPGSHKMTRARLRWEYQRARAASAPDARRKGGAFRIADDELAGLGLPAPVSYPCARNTLVLADVRGFHRRGHAVPGARRVAIYANLRKWPFSPVAY